MLRGEEVQRLAEETGIGFSTLYRWRREALRRSDPGLPGAVSAAKGLEEARRRIKDLEAEIKAIKLASELFEREGVDPKGSTRL